MKKIKLGAITMIMLMVVISTALAFNKTDIKEIKSINKELGKIEVDLYSTSQKLALRGAEIKSLQAEVALIENHMNVRQGEYDSLIELKNNIMIKGSVQTSFPSTEK